LAGRASEGQLLATSTPSVARYLDEWYATNSDNWRPSTRRGYRGAIDRFLTPAFGTLRLEQLTPQLIQRWLLDHKTEHGARRRITLAHATLRSALTDAQRLQLVAINAATLVKVPKPTSRKITPFDVGQAAAFLRAAERHRLSALFSVALACGLRLGEATGLRWEDVDLTTGEIHVRQQLQIVNRQPVLQELKTEKSRRTLALPEVCLNALRAHRTKQLEDRLRAGAEWVETGLVFTTFAKRGLARRRGAALHPRNVLRTLHSILDAATLPRLRFHDLRHSAASLLIAAGIQLAEVSLLLGHSELRVTADLYAHLVKETSAKAARHMDAVLSTRQGVS
jgi:integrase